MGVDGIHAQEHPLRNLGGGQAFGTEPDDLDFPLGEADVGNLAASFQEDILHVICNIGIDGVGPRYNLFAALSDLVRRERGNLGREFCDFAGDVAGGIPKVLIIAIGKFYFCICKSKYLSS